MAVRRFVIDARRLRDFGIGTYIRNLVGALARIDRDNQYVLVCRKTDINEFGELPANFDRAPYERPDSSRFDHVAFPLFLRHFSADLHHIPLSVVPLLMPKPYVVTIHDLSTVLFDRPPGWEDSFRYYAFRRGLLRADRVIAVSEATRRDVESMIGVPPRRMRMVHSAPDPRFLSQAASPTARAAGPEARRLEQRRILERYQINYPFLLYAGTIRPQKNIPRLVEAFAVLRGELEGQEEFRDLRLIIIGDELSRYPQVRRAVIQSRVEQVVRFLGFIPFDTMRVFYEMAAAFVFPSLYEGFGLPPLEAMACGTPVVTSNVSSLPEVVGDAAMIVNPENVFDIARGIREVLLDGGLRERLRIRGMAQARSFSWERTAREVLETYFEVTAPPVRG
jgi:glycosyltransferase involved in cell wall biosynthesis